MVNNEHIIQDLCRLHTYSFRTGVADTACIAYSYKEEQ
jgi:hypothetical protein